jgi:hypothetical protein
MKNNISLTLVALVLLLSIPACNVTINGDWESETVRGSGVVVEENRKLGDISGIELAMPGTLYIEFGGSESLRIEAEDNLMEYIQTNVRSGRLVIENRQGINLRTSQSINYYLTVDELNSIVISSSGNVEAEDLQSESFSVTISSSGNLSISSLDSTSLHVEISSSGNLEILGGQVQEQTINISSSGDYNAEDLASIEADVSITSNGTATIRVSDHLSGRLSSSGNIYYIGNPELNVRTASSGRTEQIKE